MVDDTDFENGSISNFQCHMTLTLTLDRAIWHTIVHHSSTPIYIPYFTEIGQKIFEGHISIFFQVQSHVTQQESPAVADKPARHLRKVRTAYVRAVGL